MILRAKSIFVVAIAMLPLSTAMPQTRDSTLRVAIAGASDYKHNGLSQTDSGPAIRVSADYEHPSGFYVGGFVANAEYSAEYRFRTPRDIKANLYTGYLWRRPTWQANVSVSRYMYPGIVFRYDYTQTAFNFAYRNRYFFGMARSENFLSIDQAAYQYRGGVALPLPSNMELGLNAGRFRSNGRFDFSYSFWDIGLSRIIERFALDLRYHDNTFGRASIVGDGGGDRWVFSVAYAIVPRDRTRTSR